MLKPFTRKRHTTPPPQPAQWPEGVTARYLTIAGATVDITGSGDRTAYQCTACPYGSGLHWAESVAHERAQEHAETCRALPRPTA